MIVLMAGLPGTGKTTLARETAARLQGAILGKDEIRAAIFAPTGPAQDDTEYSIEQDDFVMEVMLDAARYLLQRNPRRHVFLDGRTFSRSDQIERVLQVAAELKQPWRILECVCSEESARQRLAADPRHPHPAKNRDFALYLDVKAAFEPITQAKTTIDTDEAMERCLDRALAVL